VAYKPLITVSCGNHVALASAIVPVKALQDLWEAKWKVEKGLSDRDTT
jgi:hypothetical protein